jgi:hypothetical protein
VKLSQVLLCKLVVLGVKDLHSVEKVLISASRHL